ncbi:MAG: hypothetical protein ACUVT5_01805 [Candidatus Bathyarchaeales archaeon]
MKLAERVVGFPDKWRTPIPTAKAKKSIQDVTCSKIAKKAAKDAKKKTGW